MAEPNIVYNQTDLRDALTAVNNNKEGEIILGSNIALDTPWVTIEKLEGTESNDIIINGNGYQIGDAEHPLTSALIGEGLHVTVNNVKIYCVREEIVESANEVLVGSFFNRVQFAELEGCVASGLITITINNPASYGGFFGGLIGLARQGNDAKAGTISLSNCINNIDIVVYKDENGSSNGSIGGIIGYAAGEKVTITDCYNHGKIEANLRCIGGIIGKSVGQTTIINECVNCAEIKAETEKYEMFVGGILGYINGNGYTSQPLVEHCDNKGDILVKGIKKQFVGGIAGEGVRITITECSSSVGVTILATSYSGSVTADEWFVGGIVGRVWTYVSSKVNKCTNYSNVISTEHGYVAGIAGYVYNYSASSVEDVYELSNYGDIEGTFYAAGICGRSDASIINSNNYGNIISDNGAAAGITCEISADRKIGSCDNYGKVRGFSFASGIVREGHVIESCVNRGEINANGAGGLAAGIACVLTIASNPPGTMTNCHNKGDIISLNIASGIVGSVYGSIITGCTNDIGKIEGRDACGIFYSLDVGKQGHVAKTSIVTECINNSNINGKCRAAGIGGTNSKSAIRQCENKGEITLAEIETPPVQSYASGIAWAISDSPTYFGSGSSVSIEGCTNYGNVIMKGPLRINCISAGILSSLIGSINMVVTIKNNKNYGVIEGISTAGGIIGEVGDGSVEKLDVIDNINDAVVRCDCGNVGGLIGNLRRPANIVNNVVRSNYIGRSDPRGEPAAARGACEGYGAGGLIGSIGVTANFYCDYPASYSYAYNKSGNGVLTSDQFFDIRNNNVDVRLVAGYVGVRRLIGFIEPSVQQSGLYTRIPALRYFPTSFVNMANNDVNINMLLIGNNEEDPFNRGLNYMQPGEVVKKFDPDVGYRSMQGGSRAAWLQWSGLEHDDKTIWQPSENQLKFMPKAPLIRMSAAAEPSPSNQAGAVPGSGNAPANAINQRGSMAVQDVIKSTANTDKALRNLITAASEILHKSAESCDIDTIMAHTNMANSVLNAITKFESSLKEKLSTSINYLTAASELCPEDDSSGCLQAAGDIFIETRSLCSGDAVVARYILTNKDTGESLMYATDDEGIVKLSLPPGIYSVAVGELCGDGKELDTGRTLTVAQSGFHIDGPIEGTASGVALIMWSELCNNIPCE